MGVSVSSDEKLRVAANKRIDAELRKSKAHRLRTVKLLLLGTAECGKSTILKQIRIANLNGFDDQYVRMQRVTVYSNVLSAIYTLCENMVVLKIPFHSMDRSGDVSFVLSSTTESDSIPPNLQYAIARLWADKGMQQCYERANEFQLIDCAKYFLDKLDEICKSSYIPSQDDILHCRTQTTGVTEMEFKAGGLDFRVFDVGGQRSERKKWIHIFDDVKAIIFIVAINEYDQVLGEDNKTNRMAESLRLFEAICCTQWFIKTSMILFLNKIDLFAAKLERKKPITTAFPKYTGNLDYKSCTMYIEDQYKRRNKYPERKVFAHFTCATDTKQVQFILKSTIDTLIKQNMQGAGVQ